MKFLITGGCGFLGSNLAAEVLRKGHELTIIDNMNRKGSQLNLTWLQSLGKFSFHQVDIRNPEAVINVVRIAGPDVVFHTAGQVSMLESINNPRSDFEINVIGTFNLLEAVRQFSKNSHFFYSSTNKVYGDLEQFDYVQEKNRYICREFPDGFPESLPIELKTPYGCSKGAADQYVLDYSSTFGLKTTVFRHSSIFGGRQFATVDQGWVGWFVSLAVQAKFQGGSNRFDIQGNGLQVRDILFAADLVNCYFEALKNPENVSGEAFNIGGGIKNSLSLIELFQQIEKLLEIKIIPETSPPRKSDQKVFVADTTKAMKAFDWKPKTSLTEGLSEMIEWQKKCLNV